MPVAKQDRRPKRIHHEEHEGHEEWHSVQAAASAIGRVQKRKKIVVSLNEAHSPKFNVADKLLTLQKRRFQVLCGQG